MSIIKKDVPTMMMIYSDHRVKSITLSFTNSMGYFGHYTNF